MFKILGQKLYQVTHKASFCIYENNDCTKPIKDAHSVAISALRNISDDKGYVYVNDINDPTEFYFIHEHQSITPKKRTIRRFSTFSGFCNYHDSVLFDEIENKPIIPTTSQINKFWLRTFAMNFYNKRNGYQILNTFKNANIPPDMKKEFTNSDVYFRSMDSVKTQMDNELAEIKNSISNNSQVVNYLFIRIDKKPDLMCCDTIIPEYDFYGNKIHNPVNGVVQDISLNISCDKKSGFILLSWKKTYAGCSVFIESLINSKNIISTLLMFIFYKQRNYAYSISWWDSLSISKKNIIMTYFSYKYINNVEQNIIYCCMQTDYHTYVDWNIVDTVMNNE